MQKLNVLYFAHVREIVGLPSETVEVLSHATVGELLDALCSRYEGLAPLLERCRVALNGAFVGREASLDDGGELVIIPPVSGGAGAKTVPRVHVGPEVLDDAALKGLTRLVEGPRNGAVVTFVGQVRDHARGQTVTALEYEAYTPMAIAQLERIVAGVEAEFDGVVVAVHHRIGALTIGDSAVIVAVASPHRREAFAACQAVIDRLKADVPIWKRETGDSGAVWVDDRP